MDMGYVTLAFIGSLLVIFFAGAIIAALDPQRKKEPEKEG